MKKLLLTFLLLSSVAIAQDKKIRIELSQAQIQSIVAGLQASDGISAKEANMLITDIVNQYKAQTDTSKNK